MRASLIQIAVDEGESVESRRERVASLVRDQAGAADLVVLPELWTTGAFAYEEFAAEAEPLDGPTHEAMAKGIPGKVVFMRHAMRNALLPLVTIVALDEAALFGGAAITEKVFGLPGMGSLLLDAVTQRDVVVALDVVVIGAALMVLANLVADLLYGVFDPRARVTGAAA